MLSGGGGGTNLHTEFAYQVTGWGEAVGLLFSPAWMGGTLEELRRSKAGDARRQDTQASCDRVELFMNR